MTGVYLVLTGSVTSEHSLSITRDPKEVYDRIGVSEGRISPIFPVVPSDVPADPLAGAKFIAFLCPLRPFEFIGKQPKELRTKIWFSLGIAAVVLFGNEGCDVLKIVAQEKEHLSAYEIWRLDGGKVLPDSLWIRPAAFSPPRLRQTPNLSKDTLRLIQEIQGNLHEAARAAAIFTPEANSKFERLTEATNQIIEELEYLENPLSVSPPKQFAKSKSAITEDIFGVHQRVNQRMTQLIQLNSALAYVVSQTSHGTIPILEGPCLISTHALLGVATAYRAISAIVSFVESIFEQHPILAVIDKTYRNMPGVEVFTDVLRYDRNRWRDSGVAIDNFLHLGKPEISRPKVTYFSSRLGFAETHFAVTSASQTLHAADSIRWSLMTLTHELLHAHVTGILATLFGDEVSQGLTWDSFVRLHSEFRTFVNTQPPPVPTMLNSLRYMVFAFAVSRYEIFGKLNEMDHGGVGEPPTKIKIGPRLPEQTELFAAFYRSSLRLLEELIVHTLDLHYFYSGDRDVYLELLWKSWTTVPAVVGDLETYLLRTLVAVATMEEGRVSERFKLARERLLAKLSELIADEGTNVFLQKAHGHLADEKKTRRLRLLFYPCVYAADMTAFFLRSMNLEANLWSNDENIEPSGEGEFLYSMATAEFSGSRVKNPIAFIAHRLRLQEKDPEEMDEDFRSAWVLLATASAG